MEAREALSHLHGSFMAYKLRCKSELTVKDCKAMEKLHEVIVRCEKLDIYAKHLCEAMLDMPSGCDGCPLRDAEHVDSDGNAICRLYSEVEE